MMRRAIVQVAGVLILSMGAHAGAAYAASAQIAPSDPPAGSPGEAVYQLPFEKGRADAAPKGNGGVSSEEGGGEERSFYRSENNFGSSSRVPGTEDSLGTGAGENGDGSGGGDRSGSGGEGASGTLVAGAGSAEDVSTAEGVTVVDTGNTSAAANVGLLAAILLAAGVIGVIGFRRGRSIRANH